MIKKIKSFTLVEILLALAVLGVGLVGILSVFVVGANTIRRAVEKTEACFIAQTVFEDFKRQGHLDNVSSNNLTIPSEIATYYPGYQIISDPDPPVLNSFITLDIQKRNNNRSIEKFTSYTTRYAP